MLNLPIKILIVDDHPVFRYGIRALLETQICFKVVAEAGSAKEAVDHLEKTDIDLVLLDISMPDTDGIELTSQLRAPYPRLAILILTLHEEDQYVRQAVAAGANGYLVKTADPGHIFKAIHMVAAARKGVIPENFRPELLLSLSERRVLWLTGHREYDTARIASRMGIVEATVHTHRHNIWQKLKAVLPEAETSNPNLLVILGVEYRQRCPEYPSE
ncbi:DNA-binding response regulator, NarL/FixJ family, contains REC and HTH domains [Nitrosospira briensis]|uniref:DNA-binding response regulator, NarL/FixJ family, contains REC and HTH domains n=1 Tax=Nitrosospira briensis TaxID=35799 RepID=A0A1I5F6Q1_9PROT|nr:response regulator transcription factor [Nitrosospira briensis]SFO19427.1 DNA-binding response regulator, NarL/FixJ family, contains REC and HTH domains [Nitrosospira briensis]